MDLPRPGQGYLSLFLRACAGYGAYMLLLQQGLVKARRPARKAESKSKKAFNQDEWLKGTNFPSQVLLQCIPLLRHGLCLQHALRNVCGAAAGAGLWRPHTNVHACLHTEMLRQLGSQREMGLKHMCACRAPRRRPQSGSLR